MTSPSSPLSTPDSLSPEPGGVRLLDVQEAWERIRPFIHQTPTLRSRTFSRRVGLPVYLKQENLQRSGSFKIRGALNRTLLLTPEARERGLLCCSMGNHAQGVALAAQFARCRATIVMPETAPRAKIAATEAYGGTVILHGETFDEAAAHAEELRKESGATFVHPFANPAVIAGQGTLALEMLEQLPELGSVLLPIGGGGLASGVALTIRALRPEVRIIGVQAAGVDTLSKTFRQGIAEQRPSIKTIADGIAVKHPGPLNLQILRECLDDVWTVDDEEIAESILLLLERSKTLVEGAGAASLAAAIKFRERLPEGPTCCIISGGNLDVRLLGQVITRGLVKSRRLIRLELFISDRPGSLASLLALIAECGASVVDLRQDRLRPELAIDETAIEIELETAGPKEVEFLTQSLLQAGYRILTEPA